MKSSRFKKQSSPLLAALESDLFADLDTFLTNLIIDRSPVDARTGLSAWLTGESKKMVKPDHRPKVRKAKVGALAAA